MIRLFSTAAGRVLAALELVADDGHLADKVLALDEAVDQPVGFQRECANSRFSSVAGIVSK